MKQWIVILTGMLVLYGSPASAALAIGSDFSALPEQQATRAWPVAAPVAIPDGLRPCCAFGYRLKTQVFGITIPFYRIGNIAASESLGQHAYNDSDFNSFLAIIGLGAENNGILFTRRGGFIDTAHIRDSADMTFYLFTRLYPKLGKAFTLSPGGEELAQRRIVFEAFTPPEDPAQAYSLAVWLAARIAFDLAAWHEIAQWYGFESVPGFPEGISAFSPEDLYSNLVGVRLAASVLLQGHGYSRTGFNLAMTTVLPGALEQLGSVSAAQTRVQFDRLDQLWWDSTKAVPQKFLLLQRNYHTGNDRVPTPIPGEPQAALRLTLPARYAGKTLDILAELQLWPGKTMKNLPEPLCYYTRRDFPALASFARLNDQQQLRQAAGLKR